ncbi:pantothenate synthetase [Legionella antarctica]|uniref:Pantothenate synthetase n=1 Tax=Legionella antarctica TaxID=2708020 RepID=A0A6F8T7V8_9GAMM|nr:pantoate--beta-alanine ligase [Legionella antarctica]BCA96765.1 pantothenate synthetase [Legionella antarctica]
MQIISNLNDWVSLRTSLPNDRTLGFVPTMGNLHAGHASLFLASSKENNHTIASLFINPTQFNKPDDFTHYPRTQEADIELMANSGVSFCFIPTEQEIYADKYTYQIQENQLCQLMEGKYRPGHFNGVLTVVMKLLNLTRPNRAYFGEKDYQQYLLIQGMVKSLFMNIEIKACPIVRETSGLAYSSRNNRLTKEQRILANQFASIFHQNKPCAMIIEELTAAGIVVEYIEEYQNRRFAAVMIGDIRLIDNYFLQQNL